MEPYMDGAFPTSGTMNEDTVIHHRYDYNVSYYQYEPGRSFVEICLDMGLDSADDATISL